MNRVSALALASVGLFAAACADGTRIAEPVRSVPDASFDASASTNGFTRHVLPTRELANQAKPGSGGGSGGTGIYYHGGPVLQAATRVVAVYWANSTIYNGGPTPGSFSTSGNAGDNSLVGYFLANLGGSSYFNINTTYTDGSGAHIANVVDYTGYWANNTNVPANGASVSDAQMISMLQSGFDSGKLVYDPHTLYHIFSAGTVNLGGGFGTQYCAYHTHGTVTINGVSQTVLYSAMPYDYAYPSSCSANLSVWPNGDAGADAEVNTLAHETEETTTDMMGTAWYDRRGYENADKCAWKWGTTYTTSNGSTANVKVGTRDWLVQMNWVNAGSGGCLNGY